jgi:threonine/homoserine/homoserine lactone efflux protein
MGNLQAIQKLVKVSVTGLLISFLGSLPLGTMNITATQIAIQQGTHAGLLYALGSMLTEIIIVRFALVAMDWLAKRHKLFHFLELFTTGLIFVLAAASFIAAYKMTGFSGSIPGRLLNPFWTGVLLSATNPLHIPFWLGWSTVLLNKKILLPAARHYNWYITGIGTGTLLGFMVFIYGGNYMVKQITQHQNVLNLLIGTALLVTAILQLKKITSTPAAIRYGKMAGGC